MHKSISSALTDEEVAEQAALWTVALSAEEPVCKKALHAEFKQWQQMNARHQKAAEKMQVFLHSVSSVNTINTSATGLSDNQKPTLVRNTINSVLSESRSSMLASTLKGTAFTLLLAMSVLLGVTYFPPTVFMADISTSTGEWQRHTLEDGSQVSLNSNSAFDTEFNQYKREIVLRAGQIKINVSKDLAYQGSTRPFVVTTEHGSIEALGTEFIVSHQGEMTNLAMLESKTLVKTKQQLENSINQGLVVGSGFTVDITKRQLSALTAISATALAKAWHKQQLLVQNKPLVEVLNELNRHHVGHIFYDDEQLQNLRISAVLPLHNTAQALTLLMENYPQLKMKMLTPYVVFIGEK